MQLQVDMRNGQVTGHEGRHRMNALKNAGYVKAQVVIIPDENTHDKYNPIERSYFKMTSQFYSTQNTAIVENLIPISKKILAKSKNIKEVS